jgi:nucleoside-diphosphate-sugar epimerase
MHLMVFGLGYSGAAVARRARERGIDVTATSRDPARVAAPEGVDVLPFGAALPASVTHALSTVPPGAGGDPVLAAYGAALAGAAALRWVGYLSTTGVYGDRGGGWVDEATPVAPGQERSRLRVAAEAAWAGVSAGLAVDLFRVAAIYGPGRSALDEVRAGRARRVVKPGHAFGRIHVEDIAGAVLAAIGQVRPPGVRVLHLADDTPAENAAVIEEAARLLGAEMPPAVAFEDALAGMSAMGRSFWAENRKVASVRTQAMLGYRWRYPSYREGLRGILREGK